MKRSEFIGQEHIRHERELKDINSFFNFVESHKILENGMRFVLPNSGGNLVYCTRIDYNNLTIEYTYKILKIATEMDLGYLNVKDIE